MTDKERQKKREDVEDLFSCFAVIIFLVAMYLAIIVFH